LFAALVNPSLLPSVIVHVMEKILLPSLANKHDKVREDHESDSRDQNEIQGEKTDALGILVHVRLE
jgi:hypothetical protein